MSNTENVPVERRMRQVLPKLEFSGITTPPRQRGKPVHRRGKAVLCFHERAQTVGGKRPRKEMARKDALHVQTRILDAGHQVIPQHAGVVLHPGPGEFVRFRLEGYLDHGFGLMPRRYSSNQSAKRSISLPMSGHPWFLPSRTTSLAVEPTPSQRLTKVWAW